MAAGAPGHRDRGCSLFLGAFSGIDGLAAQHFFCAGIGADSRLNGIEVDMRLIITGALGHIGSALIHGILPGRFEEVVLLDNLSTQRYSSLFDLPRDVPFRSLASHSDS